MKQTMKKTIALLLVLVQLFVLFPVLQPQAKAAQSEPETPELNRTIVGTVKFQSFNFLGDNATGEDGTDYSTTFYYTDDYFAPSAINEAADSRTMLWSDLDNPSLAACSMDFAVAAMTSAKDDVLRASDETWNNSAYDRVISDDTYTGKVKERNVREFLSTCGFTDIECTDLDKRPTNDSIGYTLASKEITVWNADTEKNEKYTLIAVGVRGAGYGQEWASNVTIGDYHNNLMAENGRHYGFDSSAVKVCDAIQTYLRVHSITGNVKYWITGFSRAAAVANLAAGYLTDNDSTYRTQQKDVYAYTWECPQAAKKTDSPDTNFQNYKNIHNILNPMDAVPKVSPDEFEHQRLGVDYQMPYHGHVDREFLNNNQHTALYSRMFEVLKTIAVGKTFRGVYTPDPLVNDPDVAGEDDGYVSPSKYPYNTPMTIYKMDGGDLMWQVVQYALGTDKETLMKKFGTVEAEQIHDVRYGPFFTLTEGNVKELRGWNGGTDYKTTTWYLDDFIDSLVDIFLTSNAWVGGTGTGRTALQNRTTFISNYQADFRTLFGYFLDLSGPAFLGLMPKLIDAVTSNIGTSLTSGFAWDFVRFYNDPSNTTKKNNLIGSSKTLSVNVANDMAGTFSDAPYQGITKSQMNDAMRNLAELVINLYSYELSAYDSQYLGTTLRYLWTILCTHEQETVLSWIMSFDPNHMNRSCRTITIPAGCDATMYEYRPEFEGSIDEALQPAAPVVAEVKNGALVTDTLKDERIYCAVNSDSTITIRYPASLQIRTDITSDSAFRASSVRVADYKTTNAYTNVSDGENLFKTTVLNSSTGYSSVTDTANTNMAATNSRLTQYSDSILPGDTLHIMADEITAFDGKNAAAYSLLVDKAPNTIVVDYDVTDDSLTSGADVSAAVQLRVDAAASETVDNSRIIKTRQMSMRIPASSVYYDDDFKRTDLTGSPGDTIFSSVSAMLDVDGATQYWYEFSGSRIDVYCTTYNQEGAGETAVSPGYVQAKVLGADQQIVKVGGQELITSIRNQSDDVRYNVPTISFDGLTPGQTYYLVLNVLKSSHYKLDGIRVYNAVADQSVYDGSTEQYAAFISLRDALVNNESAYNAFTHGVMTGALFVDNIDQFDAAQQQIDPETGELTTPFEAYKANSPKSEIYLARNQAITFRLTEAARQEGTNLWIGLSAPDAGKNTGTVTISGVEQPVNSAVDTYYEITSAMIGANGIVTIKNTTDNLIAVTNLKVTGNETIYNAANASDAVIQSAGEDAVVLSLADVIPMVFEPVTVESIQSAASASEPTPTPDPTPNYGDVIMQLISSFVQSLFSSISRLFGN